MSARERRIRIEWKKAFVAFIVAIVSAACADSDFYIAPMTICVLSLYYLLVVSIRLEKRGAF